MENSVDYSERPKYFPKAFCSLEYSNWQFEELLKSVAICYHSFELSRTSVLEHNKNQRFLCHQNILHFEVIKNPEHARHFSGGFLM